MKVVILLHDGYVARDGTKYARGDVAEFPEHLALKLIGHGIAGPAPAPQRETAAKPHPAKTAAKHTGKAITKKSFHGEGGEAA